MVISRFYFFLTFIFFSYLAIELNSRTIFTANAQAQDSLCNKSLATHIHIYAHIKCSALTRSSDSSQKPQFSSCLHLDNLSGAHVSTNIRTQTHTHLQLWIIHIINALRSATALATVARPKQANRPVQCLFIENFVSVVGRIFETLVRTVLRFTRWYSHAVTYIHTYTQTYKHTCKHISKIRKIRRIIAFAYIFCAINLFVRLYVCFSDDKWTRDTRVPTYTRHTYIPIHIG